VSRLSTLCSYAAWIYYHAGPGLTPPCNQAASVKLDEFNLCNPCFEFLSGVHEKIEGEITVDAITALKVTEAETDDGQ